MPAANLFETAGGDTSSLLTLLRRIAAGDPAAKAAFLKMAMPTPPVMSGMGRLGPDTGPTGEIPSKGDLSGLPPGLADIMAKRESGGRDTARGKKGERGRFQFMPQTAAMYGITDPNALENPAVSQWLWQRYMTDLSKEFGGNLRETLEAYNAGPGRVERGRVPRASVQYADAILGQMGRQPAMQPLTQGAAPAAAKPGLLERVGIEGTAQAEEPPFPGESAGGEPSFPGAATAKEPSMSAMTRLKGDLSAPGKSMPLVPLPRNIMRRQAAGALDWLPAAGQFGAEAGVGLTGPEDWWAVPGAGAAGAGAGEELRLAGRKALGLPVDRSQLEVGESAAASGLLSAAARPVEAVIGRAITPGRRLAARTAKSFGKASEAFGDLSERAAKLLGMSKQEAENLSLAPAGARQFKGTVTEARRRGFENLSAAYNRVLGAHKYLSTDNALLRVMSRQMAELRALGEEMPPKIRLLISSKPMTVGYEQMTVIPELKATMRSLKTDEKANVRRALEKMITAGEHDIEQALRKAGDHAAFQGYKQLNMSYAEHYDVFPGGSMRRVMRAPTIQDSAREFFKKGSPRLSEALRLADSEPPAIRERMLAALRKGYAAAAYDAAKKKPGLVGLRGMADWIEGTPEPVLARLYGKDFVQNKAEWVSLLRRAELRFQDILNSPTQKMAIEEAVEKHLRGGGHGWLAYFKHHMMFVIGMGALGGGLASGHDVAAVAIGAPAIMLDLALHSPGGMELYRQFAMGYGAGWTADKVGAVIAGIINAAAAEAAKDGQQIARKQERTR